MRDDRLQSRLEIALVVIVVVMLLALMAGGRVVLGDPDRDLFFPMWFVLFLPIIANRRARQCEATEKGKRKRKPQNRRALMRRLVDDMDDDERAYLLRRLSDVYGPEEQSDLYSH